MSTPIPDMYQVKWFQGCWRYGIVSRWDPESIKHYKDSGQVIVEDAVFPISHLVSAAALTPVPMSYSPPDEYKQYVEEQYQIATGRSDSLPDGVHVGKLFRVAAGDGYAHYVVTKVNKKTVDIEWRGFSLDRWVDFRFGPGGRESRELIARMVGYEENMRRLLATR